ncbi:MAG: transporter substrate-binding domain-containing protein [Desulfobacterales bacterium]|nr:transporter substrate-binding domain-containing protein [Desulfobacterales bacterium]
MISTGEYAPYTTESLENNGFVNHVITEAFKQENYKVKYRYFPWKRAYLEMAKGKFHASSYWYPSKTREKDSYYSSEPIYTASEYFFYLKSNPVKDWSTLEDLKGKQIGAQRGNTYTTEFWELGKRNVYYIQEVTTDIQNFKKLLLGRIDLFPTSIFVANNLMRNELTPKERDLITYHPKPLLQTEAFLLFSKAYKDSPKLLKVFDSGMKKLINQGIYDKLYNDFLDGKYSKR